MKGGLNEIEENLKWNVYKKRSLLILLLLGKTCLIWNQKLWTDHSLSHPKCVQLPSPLKKEYTWKPLDQDAHTYMQNMHLMLQNYPTRIKLFWTEVILAAGPTFQAPQGTLSLCLFQKKLSATDWSCACCYSSWFIQLLTLLGDGCHEPSANTPSLLLDKVPFLPPSKKRIPREWVRSEILGDKDRQWPWSTLNNITQASEIQWGRGRSCSSLQR